MNSKQTALAATLAAAMTLAVAAPAAQAAGANNPTHSYWTEFVQSHKGAGLWDAWFQYLATII